MVGIVAPEADENELPAAAILRLGAAGVNGMLYPRRILTTYSPPTPTSIRQTATDAAYGPRAWASLMVRQMCGSERTNRKT